MSKKNIFIICFLSSILVSTIVSFFANRAIFFAYHQPEDFGCMAELRLYLHPETRTIRVGDRFKASIMLADCMGKVELSDNITWVSTNSNIATIDTETGMISGESVGETFIKPVGAVYGNLGGVTVTVTD